MENNNNNSDEFVRLSAYPAAYAESVGEYVLPDYNADVRKILFTNAEVHSAGKFTDAGKTELCGIVSYDVVYLDNDGDVGSVSFTTDYEAIARCGIDDPVATYDRVKLSGYNLRLVGPRKLSAKATVAVSGEVAYTDSISVLGDSVDTSDSERLTVCVRIASTTRFDAVEREFAETVTRLEGAISDEVAVLYKGADACVKEVVAGETEATVEGELRLCALIRNGDEPIRLAESSIPYEVKIPVDELNALSKLIVNASVTSLTAAVNPDENGCDVVLSAIVEFALRADFNNEHEVVTDAYLKSAPTENTYTSFKYNELVDSLVETGEVAVEIPLSELDTVGLRDVPLVTATAKIESVEVEGGCAVVSGELRFSGIASESGDDGVSYIGIKHAAPFTYSLCLDDPIEDGALVSVHVTVPEVLAVIDGDVLELTARLRCEMTVLMPRDIKVLESMLPSGSEYEKEESRVVVYYPDGDETLFDIAKKFHTTPTAIAADNSLSADVSAGDKAVGVGVKRLLIL